jgi:phosphoenolpyruvate carboxylase
MDVGDRGNGAAEVVRVNGHAAVGAAPPLAEAVRAESSLAPGSGLDDRLRDDVRVLGDLLGEILRGQEGNDLYVLVEKVRALAKRARSGHAADAEALRALLGSLDAEEALPLARAFAHFLALTNIAEQHHRVRLRRERRRAAGARGAVAEALTRLLEAGVSAERLHQTVATMEVELVLTAHPTQATRRTLLQKHRRIAAALASRDRPDLSREER